MTWAAPISQAVHGGGSVASTTLGVHGVVTARPSSSSFLWRFSALTAPASVTSLGQCGR